MTGFSMSQAAACLDSAGHLVGSPHIIGTPALDTIHSACIDSRLAVTGSLFVALPGERVDGHAFVDDAVTRGAVAAIVHSDQLESVSEAVYGSVLLLPVDDTLAALQALATWWRAQFPELLRIGITGSNGKTTTKDLVASILSQTAPTISSRGNYNSDIGMPVELLRIREKHRFGVFEAGMNRPGEIGELAQLLEPNVGVITNVGSAHVGMVGSRRRIAEEKKAIFSCFDGSQTAVVPASGEFSRFLAEGVNGKVVKHSAAAAGAIRIGETTVEGTTIGLKEGAIHLNLPGSHMVHNAIAAITVARLLEVPFESIRAGIEAAKPAFGRSEIVRGRVTVIQDCYNANPESMGSALAMLRDISGDSRAVAILGAMKELGQESTALHRTLYRQASDAGLDEVWFVGAEFQEADLDDRAGIRWFADDDWEGLERAVRGVEDGATVLVKGSRLLELERLTPVLQGAGPGQVGSSSHG